MQRLIMFAKLPRLGRVKTRLVPTLTSEQALELYRAFLVDQIEFLASLGRGRELELCCDGPLDGMSAELRPPAGIRVTEQGPGDLGQRLFRAFQRSWQEGATATVVQGVDSPTLPAGTVLDAFGALDGGAPAVIAPAEDGGYVLLGLRRPHAEIFRDVPWGGAEVLQVTLERAAASGLAVTRLDSWYDVDDAVGLRQLRAELDDPQAVSRAPATARYVAGLPRLER